MKIILIIALALWRTPVYALGSDAKIYIISELVKDGSCNEQLLKDTTNLLSDEINSSSSKNSGFPKILNSGCQFAKYPQGICENRTTIQALEAKGGADIEYYEYLPQQVLGMSKERAQKIRNSPGDDDILDAIALMTALKAKDIIGGSVNGGMFDTHSSVEGIVSFSFDRSACLKAVSDFKKTRDEILKDKIRLYSKETGKTEEEAKKELCSKYSWVCKDFGGSNVTVNNPQISELPDSGDTDSDVLHFGGPQKSSSTGFGQSRQDLKTLCSMGNSAACNQLRNTGNKSRRSGAAGE